MRVFSYKKWHAFLAGMLVSAGCFAVNPQLDEQARDALRTQNFPLAVQLTKQILKDDPSSALNWYRLSLSSLRLSDVAMADHAIRKAKLLDPTLSFASSPEKVLKLEQSIASNLRAERSLTEIVPGPLGQADNAAAIVQVAQSPAVDDALRQELAEMSKSLAQTNQMVNELHKGTKDSLQLTGAWYIVFIVGMLLIGVLAGYLLDLAKGWMGSKRKSKDNSRQSSLPLQSMIEGLRDDTARLIQRLEIHGHSSSELYTVVTRMLPALERESGRSKVDVRAQTSGLVMKDLNRKLQAKSPVLGDAPAKDIHKMVAQRLVSQHVASKTTPERAGEQG